MRRPGTDLMAMGVILGSTALAVAATLALARANSGETQDSTADCTPLEARWAVTYAVSVDGAGASGQSAPVRWRWHTRVPAPRAAQEAAHRCRRVTVVATEQAETVRQRIEATKLTADRLTIELAEAAKGTGEAAAEAEEVRKRLEELRERLRTLARNR